MKKITLYLLIALCLVSTQSCNDLLDQEPVSITHPNVFWVSQSNAEQALAGAYNLFKYAVTYQSCFLFWGEFTGMTFMDSQNWITNYIENSGDYVLAYRDQSRNWKNLYRAANWANTIETYVAEMDESMFSSPEEKKRIIGEAAFVRGLTYFYIARIWGDAPIVTESIESSDQLVTEDGYIVRVPRSNELEVINHAIEATDKAIANLEYANPGDATWAIQANKASAEALKAHLTLWAASRDGDNNAMLQACVEATTSVINNSNASLIDYVTDSIDGYEDMIWGQSKTGLFELNVDAGMNESFRMSSGDAYYTGLTLNYPIWKDKNTNKAPWINPDWYSNEVMAQNEDYANDARKALFFYDYGATGKGDDFVTKYSLQSQDPNSEDVYAQFSESNILIFRLADMYLLRAEANAKLGKGTVAVNDLNEVRSKAGVLPYTGATDRASMMKAIFDERAIEFVAEGQSGFDRIRMDYYYEGVSWMNQDRISKKGYFWPIHPSVISVNPSIVQTEYWRGKL
uniref:RagB/SusD family nutrient uptake outer membrane protein n=1 Tax=uncultured Draconibacterium sp. TaxID=1573823 RepID=UPI0032170F2B